MVHTIASLAQAQGQAAKFFRLAAECGLPDNAIQRFIDDPNERKRVIQLWVGGPMSTLFSRDMTREGWTLIKDTRVPWPISVGKLDLVTFFKDGKTYFDIEEMAACAVNLNANLGQCHAEYILEHQDEISKEFRKFKLILPGTVWCDRKGSLWLPYLDWGGERWFLFFDRFDGGFTSRYRLLRPRE
jgi:hypothetical protein